MSALFLVWLNTSMALNSTSGASDANSYASIIEADTFHSERGDEGWSALDLSVREQKLIKATDYIDARYRFKGVPDTNPQALANPRFEEEGLHPALVKATIMLAARIDELSFERNGQDGIVSESKTLAGVGNKSTTYSSKPSDPFPFITSLLSEIATRRSAAAGNIYLRQG